MWNDINKYQSVFVIVFLEPWCVCSHTSPTSRNEGWFVDTVCGPWCEGNSYFIWRQRGKLTTWRLFKCCFFCFFFVFVFCFGFFSYLIGLPFNRQKWDWKSFTKTQIIFILFSGYTMGSEKRLFLHMCTLYLNLQWHRK